MIKNLVCVLMTCCLTITVVWGQKKDTLDYFVKPMGFYGYKVNQKEVSPKEFYYTYSKDATTIDDFKAGKFNTTVGTILTYTGGFMLGWQLGDMIFKKSNNYNFAYVGAGLLAIGIPMAWVGQNKSTKALVSFNASDQILTPEVVSPIMGVQEEPQSNFQYRVQNSCYIVRVPVSGTKINYYNSKLKEVGLSTSSKDRYQGELEATIKENMDHTLLLQNTFESLFNFEHVYFLPDSSFKSFVAGQKTGFINASGKMDLSLTCPHKEQYFIIAGKHKEQLLFLDNNLLKLEPPYPYRKNIFLPAFKMILNRKGYIETQVKYFNSKLNPSDIK
jgi:hypothetical protein